MNPMKISILRIGSTAKLSSIFRNISWTSSCSESKPSAVKENPYKYADSPTRILYSGMPYQPVDIQTSIEYLKSKEYRDVYLDKPVWHFYRRNFKGHFTPKLTRKNCVHSGNLSTRHACPICRDNYLVLNYKHLDLLKQFIDQISGEALPTSVTNLCQKQHSNALFHIAMAHQLGMLERAVPIRLYDYREYYSEQDLPADLVELSVPAISTMDVLPNAASIFPDHQTGDDDNPVFARPFVPSRYRLEEKAFLEKRARKMAELRLAKLKSK